MKLSFPLAAAFAAALSLTACGGGSGNAGTGNTPVNSNNPAALTKTDASIGTGAEATSGKTVQVNYTGWLYSAGAADFKGAKFDASAAGKPYTFIIGAAPGSPGSVIPGFSQGVEGMKVGGKRTLLIPSSLGYGAAGSPPVIPANAGLVFEVELVKVCANTSCT
jgi:FKBP-type peptidyl-prolyl cis-trans isomerase FkpA